MTRAPAGRGPKTRPDAPGPTTHVPFLLEDVADAHEHGERDGTKPREEALIGTAGSHTPAPDTRAEEPSGDLDDPEI